MTQNDQAVWRALCREALRTRNSVAQQYCGHVSLLVKGGPLTLSVQDALPDLPAASVYTSLRRLGRCGRAIQEGLGGTRISRWWPALDGRSLPLDEIALLMLENAPLPAPKGSFTRWQDGSGYTGRQWFEPTPA